MSIVKHNLIGASGQGGYFIDRSVRFRQSAGAYMYRSQSAGNQTTWTWSAWVKLGYLNNDQWLFGGYFDNSNFTGVTINTGAGIQLYQKNGGSTTFLVREAPIRRDYSSWYHFVIAYDSTEATNTDRIRFYTNGEQITTYASTTWPDASRNSFLNYNAATANIGRGLTTGNAQFDGYQTEINFIDGQALTASDFGEFDDITGVWKPKKYVGSYGTNGFYLDFGDPTSTVTLCADQSGTGNNWTAANISLSSGSTYDSMEDVPTLTGNTAANYATLNSLVPNDIENPFDSTNSLTLSEANLKVATTSVAHAFGTIPLTTGKWYWEGSITAKSASSDNYTIGIYDVSRWGLGWNSAATRNSGYVWYQSGNVWDNGTAVLTGNTYTTNDIIGIALDLDNGKIYFSKNNTWINSGDPVAGTGASASGIDTTKQWLPVLGSDNNSMTSTWVINFGQRPFTYTPPTGFNRLNTYNLPDATIEDGSEYMNTVTFSGTGATGNAVTGLGFQPDMVWTKSRSVAANHELADIVRGTSEVLFPNLQNIQLTDSARFESFDSDGFTLGANSNANGSGYSSVGWAWKANGSGVSNSAGTNGASIASTYSANTTSGFSIVTYSGTGSNGTVYHGLGSVPEMMIFKTKTGAVDNWFMYHVGSNTNPASTRMLLNLTNTRATNTTYLNATAPAANVLTVGTDSGTNLATNTYVAYVFAPVEGFSAFGSYTGNGSTDGPFIYTGFRPAFVMIKNTVDVTSWNIWDSDRVPYNVITTGLYPNTNDADQTGAALYVDFLSNGFKLRSSHNSFNGSGDNFIYAAFAENPFKNALAR